MWYKTLHERLMRCGWTIVDESHESERGEWGRLIPHYIKYERPGKDFPFDTVEITANSNKNGSPGRITGIWCNGIRCDL